ATVRIPRRRQVRMMRQAISPRLAMRILENIARILFLYPVRPALLEEGGEALAAFRRGAGVGGAVAGHLDEIRRECLAFHVADELPCGAHRRGSALQHAVHER